MALREKRRAAALERIADHMLLHGLAPSSLRALAATAGTSDRMLLYYFDDKDQIVVAALGTIAGRLAPLLEAALPPTPHAPAALLGRLVEISRGPEVRPYMRLWVELAVLAARGEEPYRTAAGAIADAYLAWIAERLAVPEPARHAVAARLLATLDGVVVLDAVGRSAIGDAALGAADQSVPGPNTKSQSAR